LNVIAAAWQRIKYQKLIFEVNASGSSLTGGEFAAAFVPDPTDKPPLSGASPWVKAHKGSIVSSWWRSINVNGPCPPQIMYTSYDKNEPRFSSPGRFVLAVVNPPSNDTTLSISLNWAVGFTQPSLEVKEEDERIFTCNVDTRLEITGGGASDNAFSNRLVKDFEAPNTLRGGDYLLDTDFTPPLPNRTFLKMPHPHSLSSDTGASGEPEGAIVTHIGIATASLGAAVGLKNVSYYYTYDDENFIELTKFGTGDVPLPFTSRPMTDQLTLAGTTMEAHTPAGNLPGDSQVGHQRVPQSLTSALQYKQLSTGRLLTMTSSGRS
jgi:hypothetical protein